MRAGNSSTLIHDAEGVDVMALPVDEPIPVGTVAIESGTQSEGIHSSVDAMAP